MTGDSIFEDDDNTSPTDDGPSTDIYPKVIPYSTKLRQFLGELGLFRDTDSPITRNFYDRLHESLVEEFPQGPDKIERVNQFLMELKRRAYNVDYALLAPIFPATIKLIAEQAEYSYLKHVWGDKGTPEMRQQVLARFEARDSARAHLIHHIQGKELLNEEILTRAGITLFDEQKSKLAMLREERQRDVSPSAPE